MSLTYRLAFNRGDTAGYLDGLEYTTKAPYPKAESKAEWAGYAAGYDEGFSRGYEQGITNMLKQYHAECQGPPDPRLLIEIRNRCDKSFLPEFVMATPSHLKDKG